MLIRVLIFNALFALASMAQAQEIELLSKDDARAMFEFTRAQWIANVQGAVAAGQAKALGTSSTGYAMAMTTPEGELIVKPDYSTNEKRPSFIQVTVGYRDPKVTRVLTGAVLDSAIKAARNQLAPEFDLHANHELVQNNLVVYFFISETK